MKAYDVHAPRRLLDVPPLNWKRDGNDDRPDMRLERVVQAPMRKPRTLDLAAIRAKLQRRGQAYWRSLDELADDASSWSSCTTSFREQARSARTASTAGTS